MKKTTLFLLVAIIFKKNANSAATYARWGYVVALPIEKKGYPSFCRNLRGTHKLFQVVMTKDIVYIRPKEVDQQS